MKVVLNSCYGGFSLSSKAVEELISLGMTLGDSFGDGSDEADFYRMSKIFLNEYYCRSSYNKSFRCDPRVAQVVEKLGDEASGSCSKLRIVDIPFDSLEGWEIQEHDGKEWIEETHKRYY